MIPFRAIFDLLKVAIQFVEGGKICLKCVSRLNITSELVYSESSLLSLHAKEKYSALPLALRFHIEETLTLVYHLILFLEEILKQILGTPLSTTSASVDFLKELKSTLTVPNLTQSETELVNTVIDFLLQIRSARVIPTDQTIRQTLLKTLEFKRNCLRRHLKRKIIDLGVKVSKCSNIATSVCRCPCDKSFFIQIDTAARTLSPSRKPTKLVYCGQRNWSCLECFAYKNCVCTVRRLWWNASALPYNEALKVQNYKYIHQPSSHVFSYLKHYFQGKNE